MIICLSIIRDQNDIKRMFQGQNCQSVYIISRAQIISIVATEKRTVCLCECARVGEGERERGREVEMEGDVEMAPAEDGGAVVCHIDSLSITPSFSRYLIFIRFHFVNHWNPSTLITCDFACLKELDDMKKRLKEMEDEAAALREMQAKVEQEMGAAQGCSLLPLWRLFNHCIHFLLMLLLGICMLFSNVDMCKTWLLVIGCVFRLWIVICSACGCKFLVLSSV